VFLAVEGKPVIIDERGCDSGGVVAYTLSFLLGNNGLVNQGGALAWNLCLEKLRRLAWPLGLRKSGKPSKSEEAVMDR
jgi:hypothetical protein